MALTETDLAELLTRQEAAELMRVSVATLDRLVSAKKIDVIHLGARRTFITRRACVDYVSRQVTKAEASGRSARVGLRSS